MPHVNYLAVLVAAIVVFVLGWHPERVGLIRGESAST